MREEDDPWDADFLVRAEVSAAGDGGGDASYVALTFVCAAAVTAAVEPCQHHDGSVAQAEALVVVARQRVWNCIL